MAILDCIMPRIPLKHKCLSIILIWIIVSHKVSKKSKRKSKKKNFFFFFFCTFLYLGKTKTDMVLGKKLAIFVWEWGQNSTPRDGQKIP